MKKIICKILVLCMCMFNCITAFALMPAYIDNVTILGEEIFTIRVGECITLEAVADSAGFNVAYMCWGTDKSGIVSIDGDDGTKELSPPISTATVTALSKGRVVVTVYAEMDFVEPEDYYEHDSVIINVVSWDDAYISEVETDSVWYELFDGEECSINAVANAVGINYTYMSWKVEDESIISIECDDEDTKLLSCESDATIKALSPGLTGITIYADCHYPISESAVYKKIKVNVLKTDASPKSKKIWNVEIKDDSKTVYVGDEITLAAIAEQEDYKKEWAYFTWISSDDNVATVYDGSCGILCNPPVDTAKVKAVSEGTAVITVYADTEYSQEPREEAKFDSITVNVIKKPKATKYEVYNNNKFTGITSVLEMYLQEEHDPILYLDVRDLYKLGIETKEIENGVYISDGKKKAKMYFGESLLIDEYTFDEPLFRHEKNVWIKLDVIGNIFSTEYQSSLKDGIMEIYLDVGNIAGEPDINIDSVMLNFRYNIYSIQMTNHSFDGADNVRIYTSYYSREGKLINVDVSEIHTIEGKDEITTFVPLNECFSDAGTVKIMLWDGSNKPLAEAIMPKEFKLQISDLPPENIEDREIFFYDVSVDNKYYDAIYTIAHNFDSIGVSFMRDDGTFRRADNVYRNEFAYVLNRIMGNDFYTNKFEHIGVDSSIVDVDRTNWCRDEIGYLVSQNIMSLDKGYFYPLEYITLTEALSSYLKVLGEIEFDEDEIITLSNEYSLLENIEISDEPITREIYAQLITNFVKVYLRG